MSVDLAEQLRWRGVRQYVRPEARSWTCPPAPPAVQAFHRGLPDYAPTPLVELPALAAELGVGRVLVKDESLRLGLPAFKALGASWAIHRVLTAEPDAVRLVTATDGNHGRAVARLARGHGRTARVFVPRDVPSTAIAAEGAEVVEVAGSYDEAVRQAAADAETPGNVLVQDTAWPGYERTPGWIVEGYSTLFREIDIVPDLVVIPAGVGSLAQAAVTHYRSGGPAPALLTVEPENAACVLTSLLLGRPVSVETGRTIMAGLSCGTVSSLAWPFLFGGLDGAIAVRDADTAAATRDLAALGLAAGPCGAASLAGVRAALPHRAALNLGPDATVVLLSTEGVDPVSTEGVDPGQ